MRLARRVLGPIAAVWLVCHGATLTLVPALLWFRSRDANAAECTCAHGAEATCPMHHRTAAGAKRVRDAEPDHERDGHAECALWRRRTGACSAGGDGSRADGEPCAPRLLHGDRAAFTARSAPASRVIRSPSIAARSLLRPETSVSRAWRMGMCVRKPWVSLVGMTRSVAFFSVVIGLVVLMSAPAFAAVFGAVSGTVRDPQDRSVQGAEVTLNAKSSAWNCAHDDRRQRLVSLPRRPDRGLFGDGHRSWVRPVDR